MANQRHLTVLNTKARQVREKHEKAQDPVKQLLERQRWNDRYSLMDDAEIIAEAKKYEDTTEPEELKEWSIDRLETLQKHIKGEKVIKGMGRNMKGKHYLEPWRNDDAELFKQIDLYSAPFGTCRVDLGPEPDAMQFKGIQELEIKYMVDED